MSGCERLSDRMPAVSLGREVWTAEEEAHLSVCADCRAEWGVLNTARLIGDAAPSVAARPQLASEVLARLTSAPVRAPVRRLSRLGVALAAAAAIAAAVWTGTRPDGEAADGTDVVMAAAEQLDPVALDSLLEGGAAPIAGWTMLESPGMGDLDEGELQRVLSTWEG